MYTQCPDCSTAFRVTAEVLKQAAGKVRCGGCSNAFDALEYLSEDMPGQVTAEESETPLPELTPEPPPSDEGLPKSVSAERSAALLKTLDELAGSDIRIEDTGVEWRVLEEGETIDTAVDELLEDSPTPVDQFLTNTPSEVEAIEIFEEPDELRFDDDTPLPDDFGLEDEDPDVLESLDSDESQLEEEAESELLDELEELPVDLELGEPDEWADILDEVDEPLQPVDAAPDEEPAAIEDAGEELLDVDTQFAIQAEEMGIDLSGMHQPPEDIAEEATILVDVEPDEEVEPELDEESDGEVAEPELIDEESEDEVAEPELIDEESEDEVAEPGLIDEESEDEVAELELIDEQQEEEEAALLEFGSVDTAIRELEEQSDVFDEDFFNGDEALELDEEDGVASETDDEEIDLAASEETGHVVPPPTEEEQALNTMIDEDLLSFAVEDEDGFASTIIIPEEDAEEKAIAEKRKRPVDEDTSPGFESIIMEGEFVRSALDYEKREEYMAAAAELAAQAKTAREADKSAQSSSWRFPVTSVIITLALLLLLQVVHQSREALATIPAFNRVVGPMYNAIGKPLSPAWDVTGWRFEARDEDLTGSADENNEQLTIHSRIGNNSEHSLGYPLINITLIDRFEETIGSRTLEPAEYLADNLDPSELVEPGSTFIATISIQSPAKEATGYKLKACYRLSNEQLRCAKPDFR